MRIRMCVALVGLVVGCRAEIPNDLDRTPPRETLAGDGPEQVADIEPEPATEAPAETPDVPTPPKAADVKPVDANLAETVHVVIDGGRGLCTGALVAPRVVVTAAHCLDRSMFRTWEVTAPLADGAPTRRAVSVHMFDPNYEDVAHPDIGAIVLERSIDLPAYAELTDVEASVANDGELSGTSLLRRYIALNAPLDLLLDPLTVSSGEKYGYMQGLVTPIFSKGGDSGAGLFLIENGVRTHKLIGVERQPEPSRGLDHFSRTSSAFITWLSGLGG